MSTNRVDYIIVGYAITDSKVIKDFFKISDANTEAYKFLDKYDDNGYQEKVSKNDTDIHCIADGMNAEYIVIGHIINKSHDGFSLKDSSAVEITTPLKKLVFREYYKIEKELQKYDETFSFKVDEPKLLIFSHWH